MLVSNGNEVTGTIYKKLRLVTVTWQFTKFLNFAGFVTVVFTLALILMISYVILGKEIPLISGANPRMCKTKKRDFTSI